MSENYEPSPYDFVRDHVDQYLATDGAEGANFNGIECTILTTTGRKSGKVRRSPIVRVHDGEHYLAVASMGGQPKHPVWYLNLIANPDVTIQDKDLVVECTARAASGDERERLWAVAVDAYPEYADYQEKCDREIPVVVLEPR
jgi:deazaflavin-dependent oxidoreductase (nitroreductase family)